MQHVFTLEKGVPVLTIIVHVKIMTMVHTCAGLIGEPQTTKVNRASRAHRYVYTVDALNTVHPTAVGDLGTTGNNHVVHLNP